MEYLRNYLIFLRKTENDNPYKMKISTMALIASLVGISLGFIMDLLFPHEYFTNMIRGAIAVASGFSMFSFGYLFSYKKSREKSLADSYYKSPRERFSYRQRVNFSIASGVLISSFVMLSSNEGLTFTLKSILAIFIIFSLITFSRRSRREFIKDIHEIPDIRDLQKVKEERNKAQRRKEKLTEKTQKKNKR